MPVSETDLRLIQESLPRVRERLEPASMAFYENLFAIAPDMRPLFRGDINDQGMRFMSTLATIAEMLDEPDALDRQLDGLARAHATLGVRERHFAPMGAALMVTLGETLGPEFTDDLQAAWRSAYDHISREMVARGATN